MKKMNQFMMGMLAIAATAFTSCSNEDGYESNGARNEVGNFYMKLQVTGNGASSRSVNDNPKVGTAEESAIKSGTIWLVNKDGEVKFSKKLTAADWDSDNNTASKAIKVAVTQVSENTPYKVYFLANKEGDLLKNPTEQELTSTNGGLDHATDNAFVMFNENDKEVKADQYIVTFTAANKTETNPAKPASAIKLDRVTARIDYPTSTVEIKKDPVKTDKTENIKAIQSVALQGYAPFNVANKTYMEQKWDANWTIMTLPESLVDFHLPISTFGDGRDNTATQPTKWFEKTEKTYIFENTQAETDLATGIFLKYKAVAKSDANKDFTDSTFYRYDKHVFTAIQDIMDYAGAANPFGTLTAAEVVNLIKGEPTPGDPTKFNLTTEEAKIEEFRRAYNIEVFERGEVYYSYLIEDSHHTATKYSVLRNSIYHIDVKNIFDLGTDKPNTPVIQPNYYLNVEVTVNPWVLNELNIDLK